MSDWEEQAFSQKRIPHGRLGKGKGNKARGFDVKSTFGTYAVSGKALERTGAAAAVFRSFDVHGLTDSGDGLEGSFSGTGVATGVSILAGSRKVLERLVAESEQAEESDDESHAEEGTEDEHNEAASNDESIEGLDESDRREADRSNNFAKNSFRNPKFWMQWKASLVGDGAPPVVETNRAYIIFSGNDCKTFTGTISSTVLGWKDIAISGRKVTSKARACPLSWVDLTATESTP